jgi:hypothetical protein
VTSRRAQGDVVADEPRSALNARDLTVAPCEPSAFRTLVSTSSLLPVQQNIVSHATRGTQRRTADAQRPRRTTPYHTIPRPHHSSQHSDETTPQHSTPYHAYATTHNTQAAAWYVHSDGLVHSRTSHARARHKAAVQYRCIVIKLRLASVGCDVVQAHGLPRTAATTAGETPQTTRRGASKRRTVSHDDTSKSLEVLLNFTAVTPSSGGSASANSPLGIISRASEKAFDCLLLARRRRHEGSPVQRAG